MTATMCLWMGRGRRDKNADIGEYFFTQKVEKYKHNEC